MKKPGWLDEFKVFISRGNVIDLAVGVVVGGAFTAIVTALVNDIINPLISLIIGGVVLCAIGSAVSVCCAALSHLTRKAADMQSENDLTI